MEQNQFGFNNAMNRKNVNSLLDLVSLSFRVNFDLCVYDQKYRVCKYNISIELNPITIKYYKNLNRKIIFVGSFYRAKYAFLVI